MIGNDGEKEIIDKINEDEDEEEDEESKPYQDLLECW